jgi:hypothetical protein
VRVFENRVLRRVFKPKRNEVTRGCRKLHNEDLHKLSSSPSIIRMIKSRRMMGDKRNAYGILVGKPERKRPLGRPRCRRVDNIKTDLREIGWDCIDLAEERDKRRAVVNMKIKLRVPQNVEKFLSKCTTGSFSRRTQLRRVSQ